MPRFYFALPRLLASLRGQNPARTEKNWIEANIAGAAVMLVSYLAIAQWLLVNVTPWKRFALLLPVVVVTWIFWMVVLYIDAQIIKLLRAAGVLSDLSNARAQSVLICTVTTALACVLLHGGTLLHGVGTLWICLVGVNLVAAGLLTLSGVRSDGEP